MRCTKLPVTLVSVSRRCTFSSSALRATALQPPETVRLAVASQGLLSRQIAEVLGARGGLACRFLHLSSSLGAKKLPTGQVAQPLQPPVDEEKDVEKVIDWQSEEELARLAIAPTGINQVFWDLYRELTVRTAPVPEDQTPFPPEPASLGKLIELALSPEELELVVEVVASWRKSLLPLTAEHTSAIVVKALRFADPDLALRYLGNPEENCVITDGSPFDDVLAEYIRRLSNAKRANDPDSELAALDQLYVTLAILARYEHLPDRLERLASALRTVVNASLESTLREGWRRAVIAAQNWEEQFRTTVIYAEEDPIVPNRQPVHIPIAFSAEEVQRIVQDAEKKGYKLEEDVDEQELHQPL